MANTGYQTCLEASSRCVRHCAFAQARLIDTLWHVAVYAQAYVARSAF